MRTDGLVGLVVALPFVLGAAAAPVDEQRVVFSFNDPEIVEASGLAVVDGLFVTVNDSGDTGRVFTVDPSSGDTVGVTSWDEAATDDEAVAPAPDGSVWVGDIGDNRAVRDSVVVRKVPVGRGDRTVEPESYELVYPDGAQDAETLLCDPTTGRLYVASKGVFGGTLYAAPETLQPGRNELTPVGDVLGIATDGSFFPDGRHVVLRDYSRATVYDFPSLESVGSFDLPSQQQGEGIAVDPRGRIFLSSEGQDAPVLQVALPDEIDTALAPGPTSSASNGPSSSDSSSASSGPTTQPRTRSREDTELPEPTASDRPALPWLLGGCLALGALVVLLRSMRRR